MGRSYLDLSKDEKEHALALHKESIVIDSSVVSVIEYVTEDMWLNDMLKGGITASNLTVGMQRNFTEALKEIIEHNHWAKKNEDRVLLVKKSTDIEKAKKEGKHGIMYGPQDSMFLERNVDLLDVVYEYGLRAMQLTNDPWAEDPACYLTDVEIGLEKAQPRLQVTPFRGTKNAASAQYS